MSVLNGKALMLLGWKKLRKLYSENTTKCRPEWNLKSFPCFTSYTDLEWKFSQHFSCMSIFYHKKTLSETDFLSVSILDSCIEMPQLHKLPLSQYLNMWLEFPLFLCNSFWIFPWHTLFPMFWDNTFSLSSSFSLLYWHGFKAHLC